MGSAARRPLMQGLRRVSGLDPVGWSDLLRASVELAFARWSLGARTAGDVLRIARGSSASELSECLSVRQHKLVDRVAFSVPRVADRVPWRADCLVQALAAQLVDGMIAEMKSRKPIP